MKELFTDSHKQVDASKQSGNEICLLASTLVTGEFKRNPAEATLHAIKQAISSERRSPDVIQE